MYMFISRFSRYVKPVTKTLASLGFLYLGLNYGLVNSDQGYYVFIGRFFKYSIICYHIYYHILCMIYSIGIGVVNRGGVSKLMLRWPGRFLQKLAHRIGNFVLIIMIPTSKKVYSSSNGFS